MDDYFSLENQNRFMSVSQYKKFARCPAAAMAELNGEWKPPMTQALLSGQYVDAYVEGRLEEFIDEHPEMISTRGQTAGHLKAEYRALNALIDRFESDPVFVQYLSGEKQQVIAADIDGIMWRGKIDILHPKRIVDFKTVRDFETIWSADEQRHVTPVEFWGWDIQGAVYQELVRKLTGERLPFYLAVVTKQDVPDIAILHVPDDVLEIKLQEVRFFTEGFQAIKKGDAPATRCEKCEYCRLTKKLTGPVDYRFFGGVYE